MATGGDWWRSGRARGGRARAERAPRFRPAPEPLREAVCSAAGARPWPGAAGKCRGPLGLGGGAEGFPGLGAWGAPWAGLGCAPPGSGVSLVGVRSFRPARCRGCAPIPLPLAGCGEGVCRPERAARTPAPATGWAPRVFGTARPPAPAMSGGGEQWRCPREPLATFLLPRALLGCVGTVGDAQRDGHRSPAAGEA